MIRWFVDKNNKIPLYLQLKDQVEYYISTGAVQDGYQLPPVNALANELGITFETVRKAYKEVERNGLLSMRRGQGTFITLHRGNALRARTGVGKINWAREALEAEPEAGKGQAAVQAAIGLIRQYLHQGTGATASLPSGLPSGLLDARRVFEQAFDALAEEQSRQEIIFTECNQLQVREISQILTQHLNLPIRPVLTGDLKEQLRTLPDEEIKRLLIITTGFHVNEVKGAIGGLPVSVEVLITNMAPETRRRLDGLGKKAKYGFICRDQESAAIYKDLLKAELDNPDLNLTCCILSETDQVKALLKSADVLLVSPPVYEEIKKIAPRRLPIFNVFERVDPMSLKVIKDRILGSNGQLTSSPSNR